MKANRWAPLQSLFNELCDLPFNAPGDSMHSKTRSGRSSKLCCLRISSPRRCNATRSGLSTPSTIAFEMQTYYSERQSALQIGLSGRYLGYEASASGSIDRNVSETTITPQFY